jgi:ribose 5-phosphate isomerase B
MPEKRAKSKKIIIGADHFGLPLKNVMRDYLIEIGHEVEDIGVDSEEPVDYPDVGAELAEEVAKGKYDRGILACGTGSGMAIVANKVPGVRGVCVSDPYTAEQARASNDAQILTRGSQVLGAEVTKKLLDIWLDSEFSGGRSTRKVDKMKRLDEKYRRSMEKET